MHCAGTKGLGGMGAARRTTWNAHTVGTHGTSYPFMVSPVDSNDSLPPSSFMQSKGAVSLWCNRTAASLAEGISQGARANSQGSPSAGILGDMMRRSSQGSAPLWLMIHV
jgi:hypothetical protein